MEPKGKVLLKVVGILFIIGGVVSILLCVVGFIGGSLYMGQSDTSGAASESAAAYKAGFIVIYILMLISAIIQLLAGICGVRNCGNINAAPLCLNYGRITLVLSVISVVIGLIFRNGGILTIQYLISTVCSLLLPVLFIIGASQNKRELKQQNAIACEK